MKIIAKIHKFVKENQNDIILFIAVALIAFLAFSLGYIAAKNEMKKPLIIEQYEE